MLEVDSLAKRYGEVWALRDLSLTLAQGECLVLLGRNGAGKTTALRCMAGVVKPTAGCVKVDGLDAAEDAAGVRARVGLMPEVPGLYERMSARAYLDYFGAIYGLSPDERRRRIDQLLDYFDLSSAGERWLGTFSKGMRQKVALIRATLHRPRLVLADEPTSALDPASARAAWGYLKELQASGCALVICTHSMEEAESLGGRIGIMSGGYLLADGDFAQLRRRSGLKVRREIRQLPTLQDIYLAIVGSELERRSGAAGSVWVASECRTRADQKAVARQVEKGFGPLGDELDLFIIADIVDDTGILACAWTRDAGGLEVYCVGADK